MKIELFKGSFKDPDGFVFKSEEKLFRLIKSQSFEKYDLIFKSEIFKKLILEEKVINFNLEENNFYEISDKVKKNDIIVSHPFIEFNSQPFEWPFDQLKDAAIFHLDLEIDLMKYGYCLKDASAKNILFKNNKPIFIDLLSVQKYSNGNFWKGQMQFYKEFLNPLLLKAYFDIDYNYWYEANNFGINTTDLNKLFSWPQKIKPLIFFHVFLPALFSKKKSTHKFSNKSKSSFSDKKYIYLLESLKNSIKKLKIQNSKKLKEWSSYSDFLPYKDEEHNKKKSIISNFLEKEQLNTVLDFGCNDGTFLYLSNKKLNLIGHDIDHECINNCYLKSKKKKENCVFKVKNLAKDIIENEIFKGKKVDACLSLALIHHLRVTENIPLENILDFIHSFSNNGIIEFVDKTDERFQELINLKYDTYIDYNLDNLLKVLDKRDFEVVKINEIKKKKRFLIEYKKRH